MHKHSVRLASALALLALLVTGCAAQQPAVAPAAPWEADKVVMERVVVEEAGYRASDAGSAALGTVTEQMIIRTANLSVVVKETEAAVDSITALLKSYQGYVTQAHTWYAGEDVYASMVLRVPAESLDSFLADLRDHVVKVEDSSISGQDVTEEYTDLEARLRNLEATEAELLALLTEVRENRGKAEDILAIHRELTNIRGQIESLQGRKQYLERMTAMATVNLEIRPEATPKPVVQDRWTPLVTLSEAARALVSALRVLADVVIYVVVLSPIVIVPGVIVWLVVKLIKRNQARKAS